MHSTDDVTLPSWHSISHPADATSAYRIRQMGRCTTFANHPILILLLTCLKKVQYLKKIAELWCALGDGIKAAVTNA
jgi:hypothetical protein